ncbi:MAG: phosphoribosyltransferase, partial [Bacilli bacterium]
MHKNLKEILISQEQIETKSYELAMQINQDYEGEKITFIGLLNGSVPTLAGIIKHVQNDCEIDFMDVSSYGGTNTQSTGEVQIKKDLNNVIASKNIIIVEDI